LNKAVSSVTYICLLQHSNTMSDDYSVSDIKTKLENLADLKENYESGVLEKKVEEYREAVSELGVAIEQYKMFETEEDAKMVASAWVGAHTAYREAGQIAENDLLDYTVGAALAGAEEEDLVGVGDQLEAIRTRYLELGARASEIELEASREHDIDIKRLAHSIAENGDRHDETFFEPVADDKLEEIW